MAAQAGPARGCRKYGSRFCQKISNAFLNAFAENFLRTGNDNTSNSGMNLPASDDISGNPEVAQPSIRAGTNYDLINWNKFCILPRRCAGTAN